MKNLISLSSLNSNKFNDLIARAIKIKKNYAEFSRKLYEKTLLMFFEVPSLRTRVSFQVAMEQMHGNAINYYSAHSPWGMGKESMEDVARTISQYCDIAAARIYSHDEIKKLAKHASIPIINMMTDDGHPCQILGDYLTIKERLGDVKNIKIAYLGDAENNVTYSLMRACKITGNKLSIGCPNKEEYLPKKSVIRETKSGLIDITSNAEKAVKNADIVYTDSWMSYRIKKEEKERRLKDLKPYQVNKKLFSKANKKASFMHCLPATRGHEVTAEVIDGKGSIIFPQAENRLHIQKAILLSLLGK